MTLRQKIYLGALIVAFLGVAALALDACRWHQRELENAQAEVKNLTTVFADHTSRTISAVDGALSALAARPDDLFSLENGQPAITGQLRARLSNLPQLAWFTLFDASGTPIASSLPDIAKLPNASHFEWFRPYLAPRQDTAKQGSLGEVRRAIFTSRWFVPLTRPIWAEDGTLRGVLLAAVDVSYFSGVYSHIDVRPHGNITLFHRNGDVVSRYPNHDEWVGRSIISGDLFQKYLPSAEAGLMRLTTVVEPRRIVAAYQTVANYPLVINVAYDEHDIFGRWRASLIAYAGIALVMVAFPLMAAYGISRAVETSQRLAVANREMEILAASGREVANARESLANAQRIGNMGNWEWDIRTNEITWSDQIYRIFGLRPQQFAPSYPAFLERVHPDDRDALEWAVRATIEHGAPYAIDHRIVRPDGTMRIVHEQGEIVRNSSGRALKMNGTCQDVTEIRHAEEARRKSEMRLAGILSIAPEAIIAVDASGIVQIFNTGAEQIFGYAASEIVGKPLDVLLPERARAAHTGMMRAFGDGPETSRLMSRRGRISGLRRDGTEFPAEASIAKLVVGDERLFTVILRDIGERVEAEHALIAAKEAAELANRTKTEFLANISHELRTPLNAVIGFSEMMRTEQFGPLGDAHYKTYASDIHNSGLHLLNVINDILDVAKIEVGRMDLREAPTDLPRVVRESVRLVKPRADTRNLAISLSVTEPMPQVRADQLKIKQIVINLLSNAVKFTPRGGSISVDVRIDESGSPRITVTDTGIGIPAERLPHICQPFTQVESGLNRRYEGVGLGLALSKSLAELHGGSLSIESEVGRGTTVTVRLPSPRVLDGFGVTTTRRSA